MAATESRLTPGAAADPASAANPRARRPGTFIRESAWLALVLSTVGNALASTVGTAAVVHLVLGLVAVSSVSVLIWSKLRSTP